MAGDTGSSVITNVITKMDRPIMTPKEHRAFDAELRRLSTFEVRELTDRAIQPDSIRRAMAVTELERRRQARAPETIRDPVTGRTVSLCLLFILIAAVGAAYWRYF
jgi:hypothetical protein